MGSYPSVRTYSCAQSRAREEVMPEGSEPPRDEVERPNCPRCGGVLERVTSIPKRTDDPGYDIMRCVSCDTMHWLVRNE
jgi:uncharacterized protein with PIN domain